MHKRIKMKSTNKADHVGGADQSSAEKSETLHKSSQLLVEEALEETRSRLVIEEILEDMHRNQIQHMKEMGYYDQFIRIRKRFDEIAGGYTEPL
jgi:hypothetical protein